MDSSQWALQTNGKFFFKFQIRNFFRKPKNVQKNSVAWILIKLQCVTYQWICLNELYKIIESFFQIQISFRYFGWNPKNIQTNREAWILIVLQCVIYQWIRLDKLYKFFFSNFNFFSNYWPKSKKYSNSVNIDQIAMCYISMDLTRQTLQNNGKLVSNFGIIFRISYNFSKL